LALFAVAPLTVASTIAFAGAATALVAGLGLLLAFGAAVAAVILSMVDDTDQNREPVDR
jgi:hypothetical protein